MAHLAIGELRDLGTSQVSFFAIHTPKVSTTVNLSAIGFLDQSQYSYAMLSWCNWQHMRFRQSQDASSNLVDNTADSMSLDWSIGTDQGVGEVEQGPRGDSGPFLLFPEDLRHPTNR